MMLQVRQYLFAFLLLTLTSFAAQTQAWEKMAPLPVKLAFPVVVSLNGYIHVMGGGAPAGATDLHLRYNPGTNKWDTMAPVPYKAQQPAGAVVRGKIHFFGGGFPNTGTRLNKHFIYNPDSNTWKQAADLPQARAIHKAASIDGKLYSMGGQNDKYLNEMYHPDSNKWYKLNNLPDQSFWYGAIVVANNKMYRFAGGGSGAPVSAAHRYNPVNDYWDVISDMPKSLHAPGGTAMGDSVIFLTGGYNSNNEFANMWLYDIKKDVYYNGTAMPVGRDYHSMVTLGSCIYAVGGSSNIDTTVETDLLRYCPPNFKLGLHEAAVSGPAYTVINRMDEIVVAVQNPLQKNAPMKITLLNLSGQKVYSAMHHPDPAGQVTISKAGLGQSLYILSIEAAGTISTFRIPVR